MQSLAWYVRRIAAMSPGEVAWRVCSSARERIDRWLLPGRRRCRPLACLLGTAGDCDGCGAASGLPVLGLSTSGIAGDDGKTGGPPQLSVPARAGLLEKAEKVAAGKLSYFDQVDLAHGYPVNWHRDHKSGRCGPRVFAGDIDYRDFRVAGDCKFVWEPNRHHQLVVLARAYRISGEIHYARAVREQLDSWLNQNPYGIGMNWRSALELGIRLINWVWAIDLIRGSGILDEFTGKDGSGDGRVTAETPGGNDNGSGNRIAGGNGDGQASFGLRLLNSIRMHIWEIMRKCSQGSSANNHVIGEAAGAFVASTYFDGLRGSEKWRARSRRILCEEILAQTYEDGGGREQAIGYQLFVVQFFLIAGLVARRYGEDFPPEYWARLEEVFEFLGVMSEGGDCLPMFGDADDGYVLDLGEPRDVRAWLAVGAVVFGRSDFKAWAGEYSETAWWLLGDEGREQFDRIPLPASRRLESRAFAGPGLYLLQSGHRESADRVSILFDCGELGYKSIAAHGHADALSFTLRAFGKDVLVDPGTYDYFSYPEWRTYFRSTAAHNTIRIDGQDQSQMLGPFMWGKRARATCLHWEPREDGGRVVAEHDGYRRLKKPTTHRRTLDFDALSRSLLVTDEIVSAGPHEVELFLHLSEDCRVTQSGPHDFLVSVGLGTVAIRLDPRLSVEVLSGSEEPIGGWVSRGYHRKVPSTTLVGRLQTEKQIVLTSTIQIGQVPDLPRGEFTNE